MYCKFCHEWEHVLDIKCKEEQDIMRMRSELFAILSLSQEDMKRWIVDNMPDNDHKAEIIIDPVEAWKGCELTYHVTEIFFSLPGNYWHDYFTACGNPEWWNKEMCVIPQGFNYSIEW